MGSNPTLSAKKTHDVHYYADIFGCQKDSVRPVNTGCGQSKKAIAPSLDISGPGYYRLMWAWFNGRTSVSKTENVGSIPSAYAIGI